MDPFHRFLPQDPRSGGPRAYYLVPATNDLLKNKAKPVVPWVWRVTTPLFSTFSLPLTDAMVSPAVWARRRSRGLRNIRTRPTCAPPTLVTKPRVEGSGITLDSRRTVPTTSGYVCPVRLHSGPLSSQRPRLPSSPVSEPHPHSDDQEGRPWEGSRSRRP